MMGRPHSSVTGRWWIVQAFICLLIAARVHHQVDAFDAAVVWRNAVNVTVTADMIQKTAGFDGCDDAGATSEQQITSGDGYVEFTIGEASTLFVAGLGHDDGGTAYSDIEFAFR